MFPASATTTSPSEAPAATPQRLREYQTQALEGLRGHLRQGKKRLLLVSPTGSGKTTIAAAMVGGCVARGGRVLFLAHRKELIDQCSARLDQAGVDHGVVMAKHPRAVPCAPVQVASVQTLARRDKPAADLVIVDEAHHAKADVYQRILEAYQGKPVIGLTATPWRNDGRGLGDLFEDVVVAARPRQLIEQGHLVPFTGFAFETPDLRSVKRSGGDFDEAGLELAMGGSRVVGNIVDQWLAHARELRTVMFAVTVAHSRELVARFQGAGVAAEHLDGQTPVREREAILERLRTGKTRVVSNCGVLTEGWDCPEAACCVLARPTLSVALFLQMVGRVLRPAPGKKIARIHDHAGALLEHGLPDADRDYSLTASRKRRGTQPPPLRTCADCFAIYDPMEPGCPACGSVEVKRERGQVRERGGSDVVAVPVESLRGAGFQEARERAAFEALRRLALQRGYKPGWVAYRFKDKFGHWPRAVWARSFEGEEGR